MRLFTGVAIPETVLSSLEALLGRLRPNARLKWSPIANLHITTKFIGEWPPNRLDELREALAAIPTPGAFSIDIQGLGWFPNPHSPRVFWAGIQGGSALPALAKATDEAAARLGIARESKPFSPHLTLARIKDPVPLNGVRQAIAALPSVEFGSFRVCDFHLYLSEPGPAGSVYTALATYPLADSTAPYNP
jgi:RNA 2',3'-cyclic 3'-phosphodiesterase